MRNAILAFSIFLPLFAYGVASAETTIPLSTIEGTGTHFAVTDSDYLPVTLESSESITMRLESVPNIVTLSIDAATSSATSTSITMSGFLPNVTYYQYTDSYHYLTTFTTDAVGSHTYTQDITIPHIIFIQTHKSTKFISDNATGGDCAVVGMWNGSTKTCTLTQNLFETMQIDSDNITLDGNNFMLSGFHTGSGIYMNGRSGVTIKNLQITNFSYGISAYNANNIHIEQNDFINNDYQAIVLSNSFTNTVTGNTVSLSVPSTSRHQGFVLYNSSNNSFQDNTITLNARVSVSGGHQGILLFSSNNNSFISNIVSDTYQGVLLFGSSNNVVHENTIRGNQNTGLSIFSPASGNQVYNNNFLENPTHAVNYGGAGNVFNLPKPDGGNYWDTFDVAAEGCADANTDGFCDAPRVFTSGQDNLPWTTQDGWKSVTSQAPTLSFATDTPEGLYEDDGVQDKKGTAGKTHFTFSVIYTDAQNRAPEHVDVTVVPASDITNPIPPIPVIMALSRDITTASTTLKDGDYRNGELFAYYHPLTFAKHTYNYSFSAVVGGATTTTENQFSFKTGYSNVAFLPGLEASRLYARDPDCPLINCENQLWEPNRNDDVEKLYLSSTTGSSLNPNIYTRDVIGSAYGLTNIYSSFSSFMDDLRLNGTIHDWKPLPYDWRFDYGLILTGGKKTGDNISYLEATSTPYILQELRHLTETSDTGKVTIITHSNGGLVAKYLLDKLEKENDSLLSRIDKLIMVAAPQIGTPSAIEALLHGDEQQIGIAPSVTDFGLLLDEEHARELGENMQSAYNLLPSQKYFDTVQSPVIEFEQNAPITHALSALYGNTINSATELRNFFLGDPQSENPRTEPTPNDEESPNVLKSQFLDHATENHDVVLDNWIPPAGMEVVQIAGWGTKTLSGIRYSCGLLTCSSLSTLDREILKTTDGDGTVVVPSALAVSTSTANVERYFVRLDKYNTITRVNREHADITEIGGLRDFMENIIKGNRTLSSFVVKDKPLNEDASKRLDFTLHSPVALHLYDSEGNHTGRIKNPILGSDLRAYEAQLPNSYYREYGETKYAGSDTFATTTVTLLGEALGSFTFDIDETLGDDIVASTTWKDIPVTASSTLTLSIQTLASTTVLAMDVDGDGIVDVNLTPGEGVTPHELFSILKGIVKTLDLPKEKEHKLLKRIEKIEKELAKDYKDEWDEKRKTKHVFEKLTESIQKLEQRGILSYEEATELLEIVGKIERNVVK